MKRPSSLQLATIFAGMILLAGCEDLPLQTAGRSGPGGLPPPVEKGYWHGDGVSGPAKIVIHLDEQRADFFKGKRLVGESTVSTGRRGFDTPPGRYRVLQKDKDHVSSQYGDFVKNGEIVRENVDAQKDKRPPGSEFRGAKMPYFMRFTGGYGMHAGYVPPFRASHGCIRLPLEYARHFYENSTKGTPVIVEE